MTATDRIAQLTEELGEMRAARDRFDRLARSHEAAHERTKSELLEALDVGERQRDVAKSQRDVARAEEARLTAELATANAEQRTMRNLTDAELAEARRDRDDARLAADGAQNSADQADVAHERTKAELARVSDAGKREYEQGVERNDYALKVEAERDAAQADAAAMRDALTTLLGVGSPVGSAQLARLPQVDRDAALQHVANMCQQALDGTAGRAIAERMPLLEAMYKAANDAKGRFQVAHDRDDKGACGGVAQCRGCRFIATLAALDAKGGG